MFNTDDIIVDKYQLKQRLGNTATGHQTWLAIEQLTQENVTIKLLAFSPQMQWEELKLFEREAEVLQSLKHERIPKYRDYFDLDKDLGGGIAWFGLVQDYIPGSSLQELVDRGKIFTEKETYNIAVEILEILIYLHELNPLVIHRDIKPSNLILGEDNHIYLIDFGAVQAQGAVTGVTFTVVGSSGYAPLEQFWGRAVPASDIYALGATLIHLLTGISPVDLPHKDSQIQFSDKVNIANYFTYWLEKATNISLEKRFSTAKEALESLQKKRTIIQSETFRKKLLQPNYSRFLVTKTDNKLSLYLPPKVTYKMGNTSLFITICIIAAVTLTFFPFSLLVLLFVYQYCKDMRVVFLEKAFKIQRTIFGLTYQSINASNDDIIGVFLYGSSNNHQVKIRTKNRSYIIGENLKEEECAWLAKEIQDWLYYHQ
ncbi:serine/threonine protein kinase [Crocosphaera subtropica ATCC 51142]|uniref:Serine/threonine protein kinase n=1 Tax=Crocosphaera subtropica (strain ATCC 51142 / BH68) TaxID=43989 RepID=B1X0S2_CROS5|nr:serine/threonine-protein kinase [Crocosphaera subtropica]ACB52961.1 serine/threonine protein kinase [Crocosphaera subtropica ATCC 51142]